MMYEAFNERAGKPVLYHCLYQPPRGDALMPTCVRTINGREDSYLFAASCLSKALAFAFSYHHGEALCNGDLDNGPDEYVLLCDRSRVLSKPRHIRVYAFSSDGFEMADEPDTRQYVSTKPMPFASTSLAFETKNIDDLMRHGLQIFATEKSLQQLIGEGDLERIFADRSPRKEWLAKLMFNDGFTWENQQRDIAPNQSMTRSMQNMSLSQPSIPASI